MSREATEILKNSHGGRIFSITPSDTTPVSPPPDMIWVPEAADLAVKNSLGAVVTYKNALGWMYVGGCTHVMATGTAATNLVGITNDGVR
jgi:hypothetical protein